MSKNILDNLITNLARLPGIGRKSAARMAYTLLQKDRRIGLQLAESLIDAMQNIKKCKKCRNFTEDEVCSICQNIVRQETSILCIVEKPSDILHIENTGYFSGTYFVLGGKISPIDGVGAQDLQLDDLMTLFSENSYKEVILALKPSQESEITFSYISDICELYSLKVTRLAQGLPIGADFDNIDNNTIQLALNHRK